MVSVNDFKLGKDITNADRKGGWTGEGSLLDRNFNIFGSGPGSADYVLGTGKEREAARLEQEKTRRHNIQYMAIIIAIATIFILLVMAGVFSVSKTTIHVLGFFAFIFLVRFSLANLTCRIFFIQSFLSTYIIYHTTFFLLF